jgi:hypothetical protein
MTSSGGAHTPFANSVSHHDDHTPAHSDRVRHTPTAHRVCQRDDTNTPLHTLPSQKHNHPTPHPRSFRQTPTHTPTAHRVGNAMTPPRRPPGPGRVRARRAGPGAPRGPCAAPARKKRKEPATARRAAARRRRRGRREARLRRVRARRGGPGVPRSQVKDGLEEAELAAQTGPMRCRVGGAPEPLRSQTRILGACRFLLRSSVPSANTARACITVFFHPGQRFAPVRR